MAPRQHPRQRQARAGGTPIGLNAPRQPPPQAAPPSNEPDYEFVRGAIDPPLGAVREAVGFETLAYFLDQPAAMADEQMLHLFEHLRRMPRQETLGLWIASRGGATETPWKIVSLFREFCNRFVVLVPYQAHSSATLVALGADQIVMTEMAELGPIDPSRRHPLLPTEEAGGGKRIPIPISVQDLRHVLKFLEREMGKDLPPQVAAQLYTVLFEKVHPLAIGALEQSWTLAQQVATNVLGTHMDPEMDREAITAIVDALSDSYKSHLYQISRVEARRLGLKVRDSTAAESDAIWNLYDAYLRLRIDGEGVLNGKKAALVRLGHIDSASGTSLGIGLTVLDDPTTQGANWQSQWRHGPGGGPLPAGPTPPPPA